MTETFARIKAQGDFRGSQRPFEMLGSSARKKVVLAEQGGSCRGCGISEWRGQPLVLELEHKDGNSRNNLRENLECLCPNCHSLTPTWRGRNISRKVSDEEMMDAIKNQPSLRMALESLGMAAKGGNYIRIKRLASTLLN